MSYVWAISSGDRTFARVNMAVMLNPITRQVWILFIFVDHLPAGKFNLPEAAGLR